MPGAKLMLSEIILLCVTLKGTFSKKMQAVKQPNEKEIMKEHSTNEEIGGDEYGE